MTGKKFTADRRLYLNSAGQVCEKGDPDATTLLAPEGGTIPMAQAIELGLAEAPELAAERSEFALPERPRKKSDGPSAEEFEKLKAENAELLDKVAEATAKLAAKLAEKAEEPASDKAEPQAEDKAVKPASNKGE